MVVPTWGRLVSKEIDVVVVFQEAKTIGLIPAFWKHIEADLPTNCIPQVVISKFLLEDSDEFLSDTVLVVVGIECFSFCLGAVPPDGRDIDHSCPVLDECASLDGDLQVGDVMQAEVQEGLQLLFAEIVFDRLNYLASTWRWISYCPRLATSPF